jgi:hypothetical protein
MLKQLFAVALVATLAAPVAAQVASIQSSRPVAKVKNPNKKICEDMGITGTRLGSKRVCMTEAEWAAQRQDHRNDIEKVQRNVGILNPG